MLWRPLAPIIPDSAPSDCPPGAAPSPRTAPHRVSLARRRSKCVRLPLNLKSARLRLRSRSSLITMTVLLQAAVIGVGWLATMHVARQDVSARTRDRLNDEVSRLVETISGDLSRSVGAPVQYRAGSLEKAEAL